MTQKGQEPQRTLDVTTVEGLRMALAVSRASVHCTRVFRASVLGLPYGGSVPKTCGGAFEAALSVIGSAPPVLSSSACARHLTFLEHLARSTYEDLERAFGLAGPLRDDTIDRLGIVLSIWVEHFLYGRGKVVHPLAASWAIDTAVVLVDLAFGSLLYTRDNEFWEFRGLFDDSEELPIRLMGDRLDSARMKREITKRLGRTSVLVRIPSSGAVVPLGRDDCMIFGPDELFIARIQRCHLSRSASDYSQYECVDSAEPKYDLDDRFRFRGGLVPVRIKEPVLGSLEIALAPDESILDPLHVARGYMPFGEIPGDWIVSTLDERFGDPIGRLEPMPWKPLWTGTSHARQSTAECVGVRTDSCPTVGNNGSLGSPEMRQPEDSATLQHDEDISYSVDLRVEAFLHYSDESDYISSIEGVIYANVPLPDGSAAPPVKVGLIDAIRIYGGRAMGDRQNLWDICDAHEQATADAYSILFSKGYEFAPVIERMFPDAISPEVLIIDLIQVDPAYRRRGLGLLAARRVMDVFEPDEGIVLVKPFPLQFNARQSSAEEKDPDLAMFTCDETTAFKKLRKYWQRLGFRRILRTEYYALSPAVVTPSIRDLESQ